MLVTGRLTIAADLMTTVDLRLGVTARDYRPDVHVWFVTAGENLHLTAAHIALQRNALAKASAVTGIYPDRLNNRHFEAARVAIVNAYVHRGRSCSGRNTSAIFTRLRLTLFHGGQLNTPKRATTTVSVSVSVSGWAEAPQPFADSARRYLAQVELSLRPNTVKHIDQALREFGTWLGQNQPEVLSCADLTRSHIEDTKAGSEPALPATPASR